ncbi:unnamed protein product [Leptosia nina]|uniref:SANT domain-containing protein n=1 Tax=Leptosia nina TaxID=320188 RepID=A0AAV1IZQ1_9NEOP
MSLAAGSSLAPAGPRRLPLHCLCARGRLFAMKDRNRNNARNPISERSATDQLFSVRPGSTSGRLNVARTPFAVSSRFKCAHGSPAPVSIIYRTTRNASGERLVRLICEMSPLFAHRINRICESSLNCHAPRLKQISDDSKFSASIGELTVVERTSTPSSTTTSATVTTVSAGDCAICLTANATRCVTPSNAKQYGLDGASAGEKVCEGCHCQFVRARRSRCTVRTCSNPRTKRLRHLPPRWHDLSLDAKKPIVDEFKIPSTLSKCCLTCFKRITRRLDAIEGGGAPEPTEEEISRFKGFLREYGTSWDKMATASGRPPASLKAFYFTYRRKLQLDTSLTERQPIKGSDSDDSLVSSGDTDTASAGSPRPPPLPGPRTDAVAPRRHRRDEYDSSATETADEENEAPSAKTAANGVSAASVVNAVSGVSAVTVASSTPCVTAHPLLTVRDVVSNMIEVSLMKNSRPPLHSLPPKQQPQQQANHELATLTVVSGSHHSNAAVSPRGATITPVPPESAPELVLLQVERPPASAPNATQADSLLDLTVKRPRLERHPTPSPYRSTEYQPSYRPPPERESPTQYNAKPKPVASPRPAMKLPNPKDRLYHGGDSGTRSAPSAGQTLLRQAEKSRRRVLRGSQSTETPVSAILLNADKHRGGARPLWPRAAPDNVNGFHYVATNAPGCAKRSRAPPATPDAPTAPANQQHQHQQHQPMQQHQIHQIRRDRDAVSVIQRHSHTYSHPVPPPGHEAFTSLVNAASAAAALPVPRSREPDSDAMLHQLQHHQQHQHQQHHDIRNSREFPTNQKYVGSSAAAAGYPPDMERRPYDRERQSQQPPRDSRERLVSMGTRRYVIDERPAHPQMMHDHHHPHPQQVVSSQDDKRFSNNSAAYSIAGKPRAALAQTLERKDSRGPQVSCAATVSSSSVGGGPPVAGNAPGAPAGPPVPGGAPVAERGRATDGTLTAASLINAIITHQISQTSDQRFPIIRESDAGGQQPERGPAGTERRDEQPMTSAAHTTSIKLGDLASNIIVRDFSSPNTTALIHHNNRLLPNADSYQPSSVASSVSGAAASGPGAVVTSAANSVDEWRRDNKHSYFEPVSPTDNPPASRSDNRHFSSGVSGVSGVRCGVLTAYDYVTARIVDVMRNDSDAKLPFSGETKLPFNTPYTYPYSALNVATPADPSSGPPSGGVVTSAPPPSGPAAPEPAPLMSAQYEPLSDED